MNYNIKFEDRLKNLLSYATTKEKAEKATEKLIEYFGENTTIFNVPVEVMASRLKLSEHMCVLLKLIPDLAREYENSKIKLGCIMKNKSDWEKYFRVKMLGRREEYVLLAGVDKNDKLLGCNVISIGENKMAFISIEKVLQFVYHVKPTAVALAHNHPNGVDSPSHQDIMSTKYILKVLLNSNINLIDHFIVAGNKKCARILELDETGF